MLELAVVAGSWMILRRQLFAQEHGAPSTVLAPRHSNAQLAQLTAYADRLYTERKWLAAEKAYLSVLKLDHKNFTAYTHLGIIYSTQKNMPDAIECFEIAARLKPSGRTFQNLALAFYDNHNFIKSIAAYEKSIMFEPHSARYVGLAKAHLKLHNVPAAITALEHAVDLDPVKPILERLADAYDQAERKNDAKAIYARIHLLDPADPVAARRIGIHLPDSTVQPLDSAL
jgi:tetratricopeptide (TPR) repeat protein